MKLPTERDPKAIKRFVVALEYKSDLSSTKIQQKYGWHEQIVYDWLNTPALGELPCGGSPSYLPNDQWAQLTAMLTASPSEAGVDASAWRLPLVCDYIAENFNVEYSLAHMYRLMKKARLSVQTARPVLYEGDPEEQRR